MIITSTIIIACTIIIAFTFSTVLLQMTENCPGEPQHGHAPLDAKLIYCFRLKLRFGMLRFVPSLVARRGSGEV